jgi:hypothetical protein
VGILGGLSTGLVGFGVESRIFELELEESFADVEADAIVSPLRVVFVVPELLVTGTSGGSGFESFVELIGLSGSSLLRAAIGVFVPFFS